MFPVSLTDGHFLQQKSVSCGATPAETLLFQQPSFSALRAECHSPEAFGRRERSFFQRSTRFCAHTCRNPAAVAAHTRAGARLRQQPFSFARSVPPCGAFLFNRKLRFLLNKKTGEPLFKILRFPLRAADGNRTRDLRTTNATLYRLSHSSVFCSSEANLIYTIMGNSICQQ